MPLLLRAVVFLSKRVAIARIKIDCLNTQHASVGVVVQYYRRIGQVTHIGGSGCPILPKNRTSSTHRRQWLSDITKESDKQHASETVVVRYYQRIGQAARIGGSGCPILPKNQTRTTLPNEKKAQRDSAIPAELFHVCNLSQFFPVGSNNLLPTFTV